MNLLSHAAGNDPVKAESIRSAQVVEIALGFGLRLMQAACAGESWPAEPHRLSTDSRHLTNKNVVSCPFWTLYGQQGTDPRVAQLSAYEFAMNYHQKLAAHPLTVEIDDKEVMEPRFQARLTEQGRAKLHRRSRAPLVSGQAVGEPTLPSTTANKRKHKQARN